MVSKKLLSLTTAKCAVCGKDFSFEQRGWISRRTCSIQCSETHKDELLSVWYREQGYSLRENIKRYYAAYDALRMSSL